ncbi:MAG: MCP four helix bundle domain-containing protein, partial [Chloroflexota bacterium]
MSVSGMQIQAKLLGGFGAVLLLLAVTAAFGIMRLNAAADDIRGLADEELAAIETALKSQVALFTMQRELRQVLLVQGDALSLSKARFDAAEKEFQTGLDQLNSLLYLPAGQAKLGELTQAYQAWTPTRTRAMSLAVQGDVEASKQVLFSDQNVKALGAVNSAVDDLVKFKSARANVVVTESKAAGEQSRILMIALTALAVLLGFGIAVYLARQIVSGVNDVKSVLSSVTNNCATSLEQGLKAIAEKDLTVEVKSDTRPIRNYGGDEIGQMAALTNMMLTKIQATIQSYETTRASLVEMVGQVQRTSSAVASTSQELGSATSQTSSAVQQVTTAITQVASGAQDQSSSAQSSNESVSQLMEAIDQVARGAQDQARSISEVSATSEQLSTGVEQVATTAQHVAAASMQTKASAE